MASCRAMAPASLQTWTKTFQFQCEGSLTFTPHALWPFVPFVRSPSGSSCGSSLALNRMSRGIWAPGSGPQLLSAARSGSDVCEYSCSWPHYHRQHYLPFCLRAFNQCLGGPRKFKVQFTDKKQYTDFASFVGALSMSHCWRETVKQQ